MVKAHATQLQRNWFNTQPRHLLYLSHSLLTERRPDYDTEAPICIITKDTSPLHQYSLLFENLLIFPTSEVALFKEHLWYRPTSLRAGSQDTETHFAPDLMQFVR